MVKKHCLYSLGIADEITPVIYLDEAFVEANKDTVPTDPCIIGGIKKEHDMKDFLPLGGDSAGFGGCLKRLGRKKNFIEFGVVVPPAITVSDDPCPRCNGTGHQKCLCRYSGEYPCPICKGTGYDSMICSWCNGTGKKHTIDWSGIIAVSATLHVIFQMLNAYDGPVNSDTEQLLTIQSFCEEDSGRFPVFGLYEAAFCEYLSSLPEHYVFQGAVEAMLKMYEYVFGRPAPIAYNVKAYVETGGWLIITCPGDASCGLLPERPTVEGEGMEYSSCNTDTPAQQIMLFLALCFIVEQAMTHYLRIEAREKDTTFPLGFS